MAARTSSPRNDIGQQSTASMQSVWQTRVQQQEKELNETRLRAQQAEEERDKHLAETVQNTTLLEKAQRETNNEKDEAYKKGQQDALERLRRAESKLADTEKRMRDAEKRAEMAEAKVGENFRVRVEVAHQAGMNSTEAEVPLHGRPDVPTIALGDSNNGEAGMKPVTTNKSNSRSCMSGGRLCS